jgi:hypothetical protein
MTAILFVLLGWAIVAAGYFWKKYSIARRELADMTDDRDVQAYKAKNAERATVVLGQDLSASDAKVSTLIREFDSALRRISAAEADADRLAPFVVNFIADVTAISAQLGDLDKKPLDLSEKREAIRLHEEAVKSRTK